MGLKIDSRSPSPGVRVLDLSGELGLGSDGSLLDAAAAAMADGIRTLALNLTGLAHIDGSGLTVLLNWCFRARKPGLRLVAFGMTGRLLELMQELGLDRHIDLYLTEERALGLSSSSSAAAAPKPQPTRLEEWAGHLGRTRVSEAPAPFSARLVSGLRVEGPVRGFGQLWDKSYEIRLAAAKASPEELAQYCRTHLGDLWPEGASLHVGPPGIVPGATGLIRLRLPGGAPLVTGIRVIHSGDTSFTFATLRGHIEAGWITFSAYRDGETPVVRVESLARTGDPLYEIGLVLFGHAEQERFWRTTLENLAARFGVRGTVITVKSCSDTGRTWSGFRNLPYNAGIRTAVYTAVGLASRLLGRGGKN